MKLGEAAAAIAVGAFNGGATAPAVVAGAVAGFSYVGAVLLHASRSRR